MKTLEYFCHWSPSNQFIQKVYRRVQHENGHISLQYFGEQGGWHGSDRGNDDTGLTPTLPEDLPVLHYDVPGVGSFVTTI